METYHGHVRTPADAIVLFEACRLGLLPRVQRRLSEKERQKIKSGSVFVWDEREAGMRRWTDGKSWSASRVSGSFLTYREMEGKRGGGSNAFAPPVTAMPAGRGGRSPNPDSDSDGMDVEGPDGYRYKPDGLMKQSFSITTAAHQKLHLISYYARSHHSASGLTQPTLDPALKHIRPAKGMYPESTVHEQQNVPVVTRTPMTSSVPQSAPVTAYSRQNSVYGHQSSHSQSIYNTWPPSPSATPPSIQQNPQYGQHALPPPTQNVGQHMSYNSHHYPGQQGPQSNGGSPRMYDRAALPQADGRMPQASAPPGSTGSPLVMHQSPRGASAQVQRSSPPLALPVPHVQPSQQYNNDRYTSPANSSHSRSPPRSEVANPPEYSIRPLRNSPSGQDQDTGLSVQDIPCEKLGFREDVRALRVLDRGFAA